MMQFLKWLCGIRHVPTRAESGERRVESQQSLAIGAQIEQQAAAGCSHSHCLGGPQMVSVATKYSVAQCTRCAATEQWTKLLERGWISIVIRNRLFFFCRDCSPRCDIDPGENRRRYARCQRWAMRHHLAPRN